MTFDSEYEPFFQPPGWVVAPIWAVLYTCMAVSISTVLNQSEQLKHSKWILFLFIAQLLLNLAWPSVFNSERYLLSFGMLVFMILFYRYVRLPYVRNRPYRIDVGVAIHCMDDIRCCNQCSLLP